MRRPAQASPSSSRAGSAPPTASTWFSLLVVLAGGFALVLGWYGVSGEANVAEQLPYVASASLPGVALVVAGTLLFCADLDHRRRAPTERRVAELHTLLVEEPDETGVTAGPPAPTGRDADEAPVTIAGTRHYHRATCALVAGKAAVAVTTHEGLTPCPVCEPAPVGP